MKCLCFLQGGRPAGGHVQSCASVSTQKHHLWAVPIHRWPTQPQNPGVQSEGIAQTNLRRGAGSPRFAFFTLKCWCCVTGTELREAAKDSSQHPVDQNHGTGTFLYYLFTDKWLFRQPESLSNCSGWLKMTSWNIQGPPCEIKKQMDKRDPLAHPLLMWWVALPALQNGVHPPLFLKLKLCVCNRILSSNKSHIVKLSQNQVLLNQKSHINYY